jgi:hypothetical protein
MVTFPAVNFLSQAPLLPYNRNEEADFGKRFLTPMISTIENSIKALKIGNQSYRL